MIQPFFFGYLSEGSKNIILKRYLIICVHCSIIYNNQDTETIYEGWIDKEILIFACTHTMQYYSVINRMKSCHLWLPGWTLSVLQSVRERQTLFDHSFMWNQKKILTDTKKRLEVAGIRIVGSRKTGEGDQKIKQKKYIQMPKLMQNEI